MALWRAAQEAVTVGIAERGGAITVVLRAVRHLSGRDPYPWGAEQVVKGQEYCDAALAPM